MPSDSFGSASAHFGCQYEWSMMVDPPVLDAVLTAIFESDQYIPHPISLELAPRSTFPIKRLIVRGTVCCRYILGNGLTSGGDFNIPGSVEYQCVASPNS